MTIKMLMGEQFQPLGAPLKRKEPEKPNPIAAFERGNHAGPDGACMPRHEREVGPAPSLPWWMIAAAIGDFPLTSSYRGPDMDEMYEEMREQIRREIKRRHGLLLTKAV